MLCVISGQNIADHSVSYDWFDETLGGEEITKKLYRMNDSTQRRNFPEIADYIKREL